MPYRTLTLSSSSLAASTEALQPLTLDINGHVDVQRFGHTVMTQALEAFAARELTPHPVSLDEALQSELRQWLENTEAPPLGRDITVVLLAAHHLETSGERSLLTVFHRLGLAGPERRLRLRTTAPTAQRALLVGELCSNDYPRMADAFVIAEELEDAGTEALRDALYCARDPQTTWQLLERIPRPALRRRDYLQVRRLFLESGHPRVRAHAATVLMASRSRVLAREYLEAIAFTPLDEEWERERAVALSGLLSNTEGTVERELLGDRLASLMDSVPLDGEVTYSGLSLFVRALHAINPARYLDVLTRLLSHDDPYFRVYVISAVAPVDRARAISALRDGFQSYLEGDDCSYRWCVSPYGELLREWRAPSLLPDLRAIGRRLRHSDDSGFVEEHTQLLRDLSSSP